MKLSGEKKKQMADSHEQHDTIYVKLKTYTKQYYILYMNMYMLKKV